MKYIKKHIKKGFKFYNTMGKETIVLGRAWAGSNYIQLRSSTGKTYEVHIEQLMTNLNNGTYGPISIPQEEVYEIY